MKKNLKNNSKITENTRMWYIKFLTINFNSKQKTFAKACTKIEIRKAVLEKNFLNYSNQFPSIY